MSGRTQGYRMCMYSGTSRRFLPFKIYHHLGHWTGHDVPAGSTHIHLCKTWCPLIGRHSQLCRTWCPLVSKFIWVGREVPWSVLQDVMVSTFICGVPVSAQSCSCAMRWWGRHYYGLYSGTRGHGSIKQGEAIFWSSTIVLTHTCSVRCQGLMSYNIILFKE